MARPNSKLINAIKKAAIKIESDNQYQWGHMGACNCGHLAQEITELTRADIHRYAMQKHGDWTEQIDDFCPTSGMPMDLLISEMVNAGLSLEDLKNLERLKDSAVIKFAGKHLTYNKKEDVVLYLKSWASLLEEKLTHTVSTQKEFTPA